jgi:predicted nucleotide-binding protein (sugar kinase/HSP70/actin superfamily)
LVLLTSFGCGIDSFIDELLILANCRKYKTPLTTITLDEHTGQAGFNTRLEAFIDMMEWRSRYDNNVPTHGAGLHSG